MKLGSAKKSMTTRSRHIASVFPRLVFSGSRGSPEFLIHGTARRFRVQQATPDGTATATPPSSDRVIGDQPTSNIVKGPGYLTKPNIKTPKFVPLDGNEATANVAYQLSNVSFIYPVRSSVVDGTVKQEASFNSSSVASVLQLSSSSADYTKYQHGRAM